MRSAFTAALDVPQLPRPATPPSLHLTSEWDQHQQGVSFQPGMTVEFGARRPGGIVLSQGYSYEQTRPNRDLAAQLQQHYTILDSDRVIIELLEEEPALFRLLVEAVQPLRTVFGEKRLLQLRVQYSDEDSLLKVAVQLPADFGGDPEQVLHSFDTEWWLNNCHRSGGALVFDYEIQNAI